LPASAQNIGIIRADLALENKLNWELDVSYSEGAYKLNKGNGP
jgi:predicted transposase YbfD/YdcC